MRLLAKTVLPLCLAVMMSASGALAQSVHFKGGKNAGPKFTDLGTTLRSCFCLAGLGNCDVTISMSTTGFATSTCVNPGGNAAPGQNKTPVQTSATPVTIPANEIKNGSLCTCLTTQPPSNPTAQEAGCPNGNWTARINDVVFESATITVEQCGQIVLQQTFTP